MTTRHLAALMLGTALAPMAAQAQEDGLTVGYFLEWPMPFEFAKVQGLYEERLGVPVDWVTFDTGTAMSAAMASGDVDISISQGTPPFVVATSAGQDLVTLDVAVSYSDNDNCVVQSALEIDEDNAGEALPGNKVGVPLGTAPITASCGRWSTSASTSASLRDRGHGAPRRRRGASRRARSTCSAAGAAACDARSRSTATCC